MLFEMPNKTPEKAKQAKREWYLKNKERLLQQKRERRAANKKLKPHVRPNQPPHQSRLLEPERRTGWLATVTEPSIWPKYATSTGIITTGTANELSSSSGTVVPGFSRTNNTRSESCVRWRTCVPPDCWN